MTISGGKKKIIIYSIVTLAVSVAGYFAYSYFRLKAIYNTALTLDEAQKAIETPNIPLIELPDTSVEDAINKAAIGDANLYSESDTIPTIAVINNVEYDLQPDGTYLEPNNAWVYDANTDSLTHDGVSDYIDSSLVTYKA